MFSEKVTGFSYIQALQFKVRFQPLFVSRNPVIYMQTISLLLVILWDIVYFLAICMFHLAASIIILLEKTKAWEIVVSK